MSSRNRTAFTLIELILAIFIFSGLLSVALLVAFSSTSVINLYSAERTLVQLVRRAQIQSEENVEGMSWGVQICIKGQAGCEGFEGIVFYGRTIVTSTKGFESLDFEGEDIRFPFNENMQAHGDLYDDMLSGHGQGRGITFERFTGNLADSSMGGTLFLALEGYTQSIHMNGQGIIER